MAFRLFIDKILAGQPVQVYGDGEQTRNFTFVSDAVAANLAAGESAAAGMAVNVGGGSQVSVNHVLHLLGELLERPVQVIHVETQRGDVRHTAADTRLAANVLGYVQQVDLRAGLALEVEWVRCRDHEPVAAGVAPGVSAGSAATGTARL